MEILVSLSSLCEHNFQGVVKNIKIFSYIIDLICTLCDEIKIVAKEDFTEEYFFTQLY